MEGAAIPTLLAGRVELGNDSQPASSHQQSGQMSRSLSALVIGVTLTAGWY
jgi:hypothetical protein